MKKIYTKRNVQGVAKEQYNPRKLGALAVALGILLMSLCSCTVQEHTSEADTRMVGIGKQEKEYIEEKYGIADDVILARETGHTEKTSGGYQIIRTKEILDGSHDGVVFCKEIRPQEAEKGIICVYLEQTESQNIELHADFIRESFAWIDWLLVMPSFDEKYIRDYAIIKDNYFMNIRLAEEKFTEGDFRYKEEITVYDNNTSEQRYKITREVADGGMQFFCLDVGTRNLVYTQSTNYIADEAELVSSQKEFCNQVNDLLDTELDGVITLQEFSWENRWDSTFSINETVAENSMVVVDYAFAPPTVDEKGDTITNIVITINDTGRNPADVAYAKPEQPEEFEKSVENEADAIKDISPAVTWNDPAWETVVREMIGKEEGDITVNDARKVTEIFNLNGDYIKDFSDLQKLPNLEKLSMQNCTDEQLQQLVQFADLQELSLYDGTLKDISPLAVITGLTKLALRGNDISDLSPIVGLVHLTELDVSDNPLNGISDLAGLTNLTKLNLEYSSVYDLTALAEMTKLMELDLSYTMVENLTPLAGLRDLTVLNLEDTEVQDISPLSGLTKLTELNLRYDEVSDYTPLAMFVNLKSLDLHDNIGSDLSPLSGLTNLKDLDVSDLSCSNFSPLSGLKNLENLDVSYNGVVDITPLASLIQMKKLDLSHNHIENLAPLTNMEALESLTIIGTEIEDDSAMKEIQGRLKWFTQ